MAIVAGAVAALVGAGHFAAWLGGAIGRSATDTIVMKTNTGLGLFVAGVTLILLATPRPGTARRRLAIGCALFVAALGLATLSEHALGWNLHIDEMLAVEAQGAPATVSPNRMGPPAAVSFVLLGSAFVLLRVGSPTRRRRAWHEPFALAVAVLAILALVGYLYQANELYRVARLTGIAWPTALSLLVLAAGILCLRPDAGLVGRVLAPDAGGAMLRGLLGPMIVLPVVLGWLRLWGERRNIFDAPMGTAIVMVLFIVTFTSLLLFAAWRVGLASAALQTSEHALRRGEAFLSFALATARMGAWDLDLLDHGAHRSPEHDRIFGYEEMLPRWSYEMFLEHVVPEDREDVDRKFRAAVDAGSDWSFECRIRRRDGDVRWIWAAGRHQRDASGEPRTMTGFVQDITERKRREDALHKSEQQFRALIENVNAGVALIDESGRFSLYNRQFLAMFGLSAETDVRNVNDQDWSAWEVFDEQGHLLPIDEHPVRKAVLTGAPVRDRLVEVRQPRGRKAVWMLVSAEPLLDATGRAEQVICTYNDITARRRAELALAEANRRLQETDRRKNEFLAALSHELRNPLAPVRAALYVMERAAPGGEQANRARTIIDRQVTQLTRLVDDLLDVTRITRGRIQLRRERLDLSGLVRRAAEDYRELFAAKNVDLRVELPDIPLWVHGDAQRLAQVVGNLLHNAAKFTEAGETVVRLEKDDSSSAIISVSDTGIGIGQEVLSLLFEPFMQADATIDRARGGLGLGLALVKSLTEMHGGTVSARSEGVGRGAVFLVRLPLSTAPRFVAEGRPAVVDRPRRRILIIEDNVDAAESLRAALEIAGHDVSVAHDGVAGVEAARRFRPEIVLCDVGLPEMSGYEVARALRQDASMASVSLVALTGYALPEDLAKAQEAGFDLHVAKPPDPRKLQETLASLRRSG